MSTGGDGEDPDPATIGTFYAFQYRNFRLLWTGSAFTAMGQWIQQTTLGWIVYDLTGSGSLLGAVNSLRTMTPFFISPMAGLATDRFSRNRIVGISQFTLFLNTFILALALQWHFATIVNLFLFTFIIGLANGFNMPARSTMVFDVVPRHAIPNAVALSNMVNGAMRTIGPGIAGILIVSVGPANNFFLQSVMYLGVLATVLALRLPPRPSTVPRKPSFRDMTEGYRFVIKSPQARLLLIMGMLPGLFLIPTHMVILPIYAKDVFEAGSTGAGAGAASLGVMVSSIGFGGFLGAMLTASLNRVDRRGLLQLGALFVYSIAHIAYAILGVVTADVRIAAFCLVFAGAAESVYGTTNQTVLQLMAPSDMRGRIVAALQVQPLCLGLGGLMAGAAADHFGPTETSLFISVVAFAIGLTILIFSPRMRDLRISRLGPEAVPARAT